MIKIKMRMKNILNNETTKAKKKIKRNQNDLEGGEEEE